MKGLLITALVVVSLLCVVSNAKLGYFWHISDNHMQSDYKEGTDPEWHCTKYKGDAGKFGHYKCRAPYAVEFTAISEIPTLRPDECKNDLPQFILWTGDSVASRLGSYEPDAITWDLRNVTDLFNILRKKLGAKIPVYPVLGNHDSSPQHFFKAVGDWVYPVVAKLWQPYLPADAIATLSKSGYYSVKVNNKLRLIVLNTNLYYELNNLTLGVVDPGGQIKWLHNELQKAKNNNELVYIAGHVPPRGMGGCFRPEYGKPFLEAMKGFHSIIKASFWGHCHMDAFHLVGNITSGDYHVGHYAPTLGTNYYTDPAFRRVLIDTDTFEVKNWRTFYMHLPDANKEGRIRWKVLYDAHSAYGIEDANPKTMLSLIKKMSKDSNLFKSYYNRLKSGANMGACDESCKKKWICSMLYPHMYGYDECVKGTLPSTF